jgi:hypothetical protein
MAPQFPPSRLVFDPTGKWLPGQQSAVQRVGMTAEQRTQADQAAANALPKTEPELALVVNDPSKPQALRDAAKAALATMVRQHNAERPVTNVNMNAPPPNAPAITADTPHGESFLSSLAPDLANTVRSYMAGQSTFPGGVAAKSPYFIQLANLVKWADPGWSEQVAQQRKATMAEFSSTSNTRAGGQVLALNTLIHHADLYQQVADSLKNGSFVPGSAAYNAVATMFGSAPPTQANLVARFLAGETGKVATGGVPAEGEINGILKGLGNNASPDQIAGAAKSLLAIAAGRMIPLQERVNNAKLQGLIPILGPDAKEILQRRGYDPNTMKPVQGNAGGLTVTYNGHVFTFTDPAKMAQFKKDQGIQ